jgi:hypothetical protein
LAGLGGDEGVEGFEGLVPSGEDVGDLALLGEGGEEEGLDL